MDLTSAFWKIHEGLPRQNPGSDPATRSMLRLAGGAKNFTNALDIGCGPGRASLVLAEQGIHVTAVDNSKAMLAELAKAAKELTTIEVKQADIRTLPFANESFDLIWSEGSIYVLGWEKGLRTWSQYLKPGGMMVITECAWLTATPSDEAKDFWQRAYPAMLNVPTARAIAEKSGLEVVHTYIISDNDWYEEYYNPLMQRHDDLRNETDPAIRQAIAVGRAEIDIRDRHPKEYGYVGFIMKKRPS